MLGTAAEPALRAVAVPRAPAWGLLEEGAAAGQPWLASPGLAAGGLGWEWETSPGIVPARFVVLCSLEHLRANWRPAPSAAWHWWVPDAFRPSLCILSR